MHILFADQKGNLADYSGLLMLGRRGSNLSQPGPKDMIPLPEGATLTLVPDRLPVGLNPETGEAEALENDPYSQKGQKIFAVAALLPQGYTRTFLPAWYTPQKAGNLPLYGYTAVAAQNGKIYCAAMKTDVDKNWNPKFFNTPDLESRIANMRKGSPDNRILKQLAKCALEYSCFTAQNLFYRRWEGGLPVSPACNANCLGCISLQPSECCPSPQQRIDFVPKLTEVVEVMQSHLKKHPANIISFGQGCEGEPSLQADLIAAAIKEVRNNVKQGTININTNAGNTEGIIKIADAGLDHARVSLISARAETYEVYYQPKQYTLENVKNSLKELHNRGVFTALNLLTFPGLTDRAEELDELIKLINDCGVKQVQYRNLNFDPDKLFKLLPTDQLSLGIYRMIKILKKDCPNTTFGNYTQPLEGPKDKR